jgi:hypothetical protein
MIRSRLSARQRGASILTLLVLAFIAGFIVLMGMRVFPSVNEFLTIRKAVSHIMSTNPTSPAEIRNSFEKTTEVQQIGDTGAFRTSFAYNVEVPIFEPTVYLLMKYSGSASSGGIKGP